jgi:hypothetical protein
MFIFLSLVCYEGFFKYTGLLIHNMLILYGEDLLANRPTPMLEGHRFSAVRDRSLIIFVATLYI